MAFSDLTGLIAGDSAAWREFVAAYSELVKSAIRRTLHSYAGSSQRTDTEEISQEFFLRIVRDDFRLLRSFDPARASLTTWLAVIARNLAIDHLRSRQASVPLDEAGEVAGRPVCPQTTLRFPDGLLTGRQELILTLFFEKEMGVSEIASFLQVEEQTVRSMKHKALQRLREYQEQHGAF